MSQLTQAQRDSIQVHTLGLSLLSAALAINSANLPKSITDPLEETILKATKLVAECNKTLSGE